MDNNDKLIHAIVELTNIQLQIDSNGGPEKNGEFFDNYFHARARILACFGLPDSDEFGKILLVKTFPSDEDLDNIIANLKQSATDYLLSPVKTEGQILEDAIQQGFAPEKVLPELGISAHVYTLFVYREILLAKKDHPLSVLEALRLANNPKTLNSLGIVGLSKKLSDEEIKILNYLKSKGIKYLDQYIASYQFDANKEEIKYNQLSEFWNDLNGGFDFRTLEDKFTALTHYLMNYLCLVVAGQAYRITETEIYYFDENNHPDPYVHCASEQLHAGNWYFNGFGLDITFGDNEKKIYGGILIRGIMKLDIYPRYISGPSNVLKEVFSNIGNIIFSDGGIYLRELHEEVIREIEEEPIRSSRIGLTKKNDDTGNYAEKKYRFIVGINYFHKFKDKEKIVRLLLIENKINRDEAQKIMGYNINL